MAKNKKGKAKGGSKSLPHKGPPSTQRKTGRGEWKQTTTEENYTASFTMRDAARFSDVRPSSHLGTKSDLRNQKMSFVSGGDLEGMDLEAHNPSKSASPLGDVSQHEQLFLESPRLDFNVRPNANGKENESNCSTPPRTAPSEDKQQDRGTIGTNSEAVQGPDKDVHRYPSPVSSSSSEEVVVFRGRSGVGDSRLKRSGAPLSTFAMVSPISKSQSQRMTESQFNAPRKSLIANLRVGEDVLQEDRPCDSVYKYRSALPDATVNKKSQDLLFNGSTRIAPGRRHEKRRNNFQSPSDIELEEAIYADYIANVRENESDGNTGQPNVQSSNNVRDLNGWHPSDIQDFDNMSTSEDIMEGIEQVLSKRERGSGTQYLVVWRGQTVDDARWISQSSLTMQGAQELITTFEEEDKLIREYQDQSWETEDSDDNDDDNDSNAEDDLESEFEDEQDLMQRRMDRMTDEQIARMLTKQEELGMGSDELLLFDQEVDDGSVEDADDDIEGVFGFTLPSRSRGNPRRRHQFTFADGALDDLGDDYGDFDVMDHERPSLRQHNPTGRDPVAALGISDSDLEATLRTSWAADRSKKKRRKQEREELRAQGLLGKKAKVKADFSAKYKDGMSVQMFRQELEIFLDADHDTRPFPPMDKRDRKVLHHLAAGFNLKSKSQGKGSGRFTVLFKTSRTLSFDDDLFDRLSARLERQFWPTPGGSKGKKTAGLARSRAGGVAGWNVRDGQMVGAGAPELGVENRGRAMLEKMGWSKGNALGTLDNQGILQPIEHIVKTSKTGLG